MMQAAVRCYCRKRICGAFCERDVIPADPKQWPRCECGEAMEFIVVHPDKLLGVTSLKDLARQVLERNKPR